MALCGVGSAGLAWFLAQAKSFSFPWLGETVVVVFGLP